MRELDPDTVRKFQSRIKMLAHKWKLDYLAEDLSQEVICRILEGKSRKASLEYAAIDVLRMWFCDKRVKSYVGRKMLTSGMHLNLTELLVDDGALPDARVDAIKCLNAVSGRDRAMLEKYFILGMTMDEIGKSYRITTAGASIAITKAIKKIRAAISLC